MLFDWNQTEFHVGVVENTPTIFRVKVGRTPELCKCSKTLEFTKIYPFKFTCNYKSLALFQKQIIRELTQNNFQNFGNDENPEKEIYQMIHRFHLDIPQIPVTRLP